MSGEIGVAIGGVALILAMLGFAQRLGAWENKHLARLLVLLAGGLGIAWLLYFVPKPWAWVASMLVVGLLVWPAQGWLEEYRGRKHKTFPLEAGGDRDHWMRTAISRETLLDGEKAKNERLEKELEKTQAATFQAARVRPMILPTATRRG